MNLTRRDFFTSCSKDMLRNAFNAWHDFQDEMQKEANKLTCDEAAFKLSRYSKKPSRKAASQKLAGSQTKFIFNSKGGKK
jgi:hypothetical protein